MKLFESYFTALFNFGFIFTIFFFPFDFPGSSGSSILKFDFGT